MAKLYINAHHAKGKINKEIYGHFSEHLGRCIYEGLYVGEHSDIPNTNGMRNDVVEALKEMKLPVLRWPGGCFADEYHWKEGIGPKEWRKKMINTHWGGVVEDNSFGTHEFMELCRQLECEAYINGNLGSGTVQEMSEWVEYLTFDGISPMSELRKQNGQEKAWNVGYFGVGNENWGCGGNMTPEFYANEYRRYQTYVRNYKSDQPIKKIACGANAEDYDWTKKVLETCFYKNNHGFMDGLSLHYYTIPSGDWQAKGSATEFTEEEYYKTLHKTLYMETLMKRHGAIMDEYDPDKNIGMMIDEWGTWYDVEPGTNPGFLYQQNTMRDAIVTGINLNLFNQNCDRVKMANIAQLVNVLQAVILTEGSKMIKTPTYYVFHMYRHHQEGMLQEAHLDTEQIEYKEIAIPKVSQSVSKDAEGVLHITLVNLSATEREEMTIELQGQEIQKVTAEVLENNMHAKNTFEKSEVVKERIFEEINVTEQVLKFTMPSCSIMHIAIQ